MDNKLDKFNQDISASLQRSSLDVIQMLEKVALESKVDLEPIQNTLKSVLEESTKLVTKEIASINEARINEQQQILSKNLEEAIRKEQNAIDKFNATVKEKDELEKACIELRLTNENNLVRI